MRYLCACFVNAGCALLLAGCGGGGTTPIAYSPPPPAPSPPPTPTPAAVPVFIPKAPATQEFTVKGATFNEIAFPKYDGPLVGKSDQLRIRYDSASNAYEVLAPSGASWGWLSQDGQNGGYSSPSGIHVQIAHDYNHALTDPENAYSYSALADWYDGASGYGSVAFGVATEAGAIPLTGSATYNGYISGHSNETWDWNDWGRGVAAINGEITLAFDFGRGSLSGSLSPQLYLADRATLPTLTFTNTVYSTGSTSFSGSFDTSLPGANSFSGLFTGPAANELIGDFRFPYRSPFDNHVYEAGGGFVAKQ